MRRVGVDTSNPLNEAPSVLHSMFVIDINNLRGGTAAMQYVQLHQHLCVLPQVLVMRGTIIWVCILVM